MAGSARGSVGIMKYFGSNSKRPRNADKVNYSEVVLDLVSSSNKDKFSNCEADEAKANLEPDDIVNQSSVSTAQMAEEMDDEQETIASTSSHSNEVSKPSEPANDESSRDDECTSLDCCGGNQSEPFQPRINFAATKKKQGKQNRLFNCAWYRDYS